MATTPTPQGPLARVAPWGRFVFLTVLTMGTYPLVWAAKKAPALRRKALLLRAARLQDPGSNPSSWPWLRSAWAAWLCSALLAELIVMVAMVLVGIPVTTRAQVILKHTGHLPTGYMLGFLFVTAIAVLPQGWILTEALVLLSQTLRPERVLAALGRRWEAAVEKSQARVSRWGAFRSFRPTAKPVESPRKEVKS